MLATSLGYDVRAFGASGSAQSNISVDDTAAFQATIDTAALKNRGSIFIPENEGAYQIRGRLHSPENVDWKFAGGVVSCGNNSASVLINGGVIPATFHSQCFIVHLTEASNSPLKIRSALPQGSQPSNTAVSVRVTRMSPDWFDGSMSEKIQKVFQTGGSRTVCTVPSGQFEINSTISLSEKNTALI